MNAKDILLIVAVLVLAGLCYYLYSGLTLCKSKALECAQGVEKLKSGLNECMTGAQQCQQALTNLQQMCAPYLPSQ